MCLDFALEINSKLLFAYQAKSGLWEDRERVKDSWRSFYLFKISLSGQGGSWHDCSRVGLLPLSFLCLLAVFLSLVPAFPIFMPAQGPSASCSVLLPPSTADTSHEDMRLNLLPSVVFVSLFSSLQFWDVWVKWFLAEQLIVSHWQCGLLVLDRSLPLQAVGVPCINY